MKKYRYVVIQPSEDPVTKHAHKSVERKDVQVTVQRASNKTPIKSNCCQYLTMITSDTIVIIVAIKKVESVITFIFVILFLVY